MSTGKVVRLESGPWRLELLPALGASILNLSAHGRPVLRHVELSSVQTSSQCGSFALAPFSNRIRDARFTFGGREIVLRANTRDGLAQHGDVRNRPWQVAQPDDHHLSAEFDSRLYADLNWPWAFTARQEFVAHGPHLDLSLTLTNASDSPMPAGIGFHPYFARQDGATDPTVQFVAGGQYPTDERSLPVSGAQPIPPALDFSAPRPVGEATIDTVYAGWDGVARLDWGQGQAGGRALTITADTAFSHLVVFTAPDGSLALEPVSHATDAFNLAARGVRGTDMRTLEPGASLAAAVRFTLEGEW